MSARVPAPGAAAGPEPAGPHVLGPGLLLGVGLGGFVDGIVLHQILQWHHLLSERGYATNVQIAADGFFHGLTWIAVLAGVLWLWRRLGYAGPLPWAALIGPMLAGWGVFNLVEGLIDHHLLGVHHVRAGPGRVSCGGTWLSSLSGRCLWWSASRCTAGRAIDLLTCKHRASLVLRLCVLPPVSRRAAWRSA